jgi:hypothetical protein
MSPDPKGRGRVLLRQISECQVLRGFEVVPNLNIYQHAVEGMWRAHLG